MARIIFFNLGLISIFAQALLLRELQVSFYGNELFMGVILAFWLLSTGLGSFLVGKLAKRFQLSKDLVPMIAFLLVGILAPLTLILIRISERFLFTFGELKNIFAAFGFSFFAIFPLCFVLGAIFPLGLMARRGWTSSRSNLSANLSVSQAYFWETLGHAVAGVLFSFFLVELTSLWDAILVAMPCFLATVFLRTGCHSEERSKACPRAKRRKESLNSFEGSGIRQRFFASAQNDNKMSKVFVLVSLFTIFILLLSPLPNRLELSTQKYRYPNLIEIKNSPYGQIAVTKSGTQTEVYESGLFLGTTAGDLGFNERLIHLSLSAHPNPERVLLIGGGWNGALSEILKCEGVLRVDYVELDPILVSTVEKYLDPQQKEALKNPKVNLHLLDGRRFLKETPLRETSAGKTRPIPQPPQEKPSRFKDSNLEGWGMRRFFLGGLGNAEVEELGLYDVVIFNLPNPSTAMINRFYTEECFLEVKNILAKDGVFATYLSAPTDYLSGEAQNLLASVYWTLKEVFGEVLILPQEEVLFISGFLPAYNLGVDGSIPSQRFKEREIKTSFLTAEEIEMRFEDPRSGEIEILLTRNKDAKKNFDFHPAGYFYEAGFWQTMFSFKVARVFESLSKISLLWVFAFLTALVLISSIFIYLKIRQFPNPAKENLGGFLGSNLRGWGVGRVFLGGFFPILAVAFTGFALMTFEMILILAFQSKFGFLYSKLALLLGLLLLGMGLGNIFSRKRLSSNLALVLFLLATFFAFLPGVLVRFPFEVIYFLLTLLGGFLAGTVFPLAVNLRGSDERASGLYSADLFGSVLGAILPSLFLIPLWGIGATSFFVAGLAVLIALRNL